MSAHDNHVSSDVLPSPLRVHKEAEADTRGLGLGNASFGRVIFRNGCGLPLTSTSSWHHGTQQNMLTLHWMMVSRAGDPFEIL